MRFEAKCGAAAISLIAALWFSAIPASAQWRYYNGYQAYPPPSPSSSTYPPFPEDQGYQTPPPDGRVPYGYGSPAYGEPQPAPPGNGGYGNPPDQRTYANPPPTNNNTAAVYNPPPNDAQAAASPRTRQEVDYSTTQPAGTIVVDTQTRHLYLVQGGGKAIEYGIGVGREGFAWKGVAKVGNKQEWPKWFPPQQMLQRRPDLPIEMDGGLGNPLGARALYLYEGGKDTLFRIHGTNEPDTIGKAVSSGCIRMMNADVMDLYNRVPIGTKVVVL